MKSVGTLHHPRPGPPLGGEHVQRCAQCLLDAGAGAPAFFFGFFASGANGTCPAAGDTGSAAGLAAGPITCTPSITGSGRGTSPMNGPCGPVVRLSILSTTSMPCTTLPNTA